MSNPINVCVGLFFLWFGWIAFNSGSTYGLTAGKWEYAARAAGNLQFIILVVLVVV